MALWDVAENIRDPFVRDHARNILSNIKDMMKMTAEDGSDEIAYEMPTILDVPGMTQEKSQKLVYFIVMTDLLKNKCQIKLFIDKETSILKIKWVSKRDDKIMDIVNDFFKKTAIQK